MTRSGSSRRLSKANPETVFAVRRPATVTTRAASNGTTPQMAMPARAPKWLVSSPMTGAPMGVPPMKASMYRPMTRPRSSGSTASWTEALAMDWNTRLTKPIAASRARNTAMSGAIAADASNSPKAAAESTRIRRLGWALAPASSAPEADPIASTILNSPYVPALPWNVDLAIAVSTTGKLRPNVPSIPTRKIVQMTSGRPRRCRAAVRSARGSRRAGGAGVRSDGRSRSSPTVGLR
jgi:hypothetical protein